MNVVVKRGLSSKEARRRLELYGPNTIVHKKKLSPFTEFLLKFKNPLVIVLLIAALISFFVGDTVSSAIIIIMVLISTILDFTNTYRSKKAADELVERVRLTVGVKRDGTLVTLAVEKIVPGDLVALEPGKIVPADGSLVSAEGFFVDESSLTGESFPLQRKETESVFMGSNVITGEAMLLVEQTGKETKFSHIAEALMERDVPTDFDRGIKDFSLLIIKVIFVLVLTLFLLNAFTKHNPFESFLFAIALAVGVTPELLPMIITLNLSRGALAMSKHGVIVKKLSSIQSFGSMDVFCTDKTGTLTEGKIALVKYVDGHGETKESVLRYAYINSYYETGIHNPLDEAVRKFKHLSVNGYKKIDEIPFDFIRKRGSVVVHDGSQHLLIAKGAPEEMFKVIRYFENEHHLFEGHIKKKVNLLYQELSSQGFRVLAVAKKEIRAISEHYGKEVECNMTFLGFVAFLDPPKESVGAP